VVWLKECDYCVLLDINTVVPVVNQPDEAEMLATRPMSYVLALDNGMKDAFYFLKLNLVRHPARLQDWHM